MRLPCDRCDVASSRKSNHCSNLEREVGELRRISNKQCGSRITIPYCIFTHSGLLGLGDLRMVEGPEMKQVHFLKYS